MQVSWEESANGIYHGFLKLLDVQKDGYDLHATYPASGDLPHLSLYTVENSATKEHQAQTKMVWNSLAITDGDQLVFATAAPSCTATLLKEFLTHVLSKHRELHPPKPTVVTSSPPTLGSAIVKTKANWAGAKKDISDHTTFPSLSPNLQQPANKPALMGAWANKK